jgi:hypothetical protein
MNRVTDYLKIPQDYEGNRYSLNWSASGDAVDRPDGSTFAHAAQIALFLEGYCSSGRLIHFSYILYMLHRLNSRLLENEEPDLLSPIGPSYVLDMMLDSLASAFQKSGQPLRNAGALCAWLCRNVPPVLDPPDSRDLCTRLSNGSLASDLAIRRVATSPLIGEVEIPPLSALDFEMRLQNALKQLGPDEIASWLRHGRGPLREPGLRVAEEIDALKPKTIEGILAALSARERLAGAIPMVAQLVSALNMPPRRLAHQALPTGGYADVTTRGRPEQILPSQFAIDDVEFLRRFAENELLYFHREEPHAPVTEELVLLLDQGVRTWGRVRHALAASALAFAKLASRKKLPFLLGTTSTDGQLFDPLQTDAEFLGAVWESSDLSPNPSLALEQILETPGKCRRDVVVLSHPRNVAEADFAAAARRATPDTRVFTVAIDEPGQVLFREWRRGIPVKVVDFRVDFSPLTAPKQSPALSSGPDPRGWRGDVEPVPFPFRFGVVHRIEKPLFDFDHAGRWLLLCTFRGLLHAWKLDGSRAEVLPRALVDGEVLEQVDAVLGVADGFVVGGRVGKSLVAMHYDLGSRTARARVLGPTFDGEWLWFYSRELHTVVARGRTYSRALDLSTREIHVSRDSKSRPPARAIRAFEMAANHFLPPPRLPIVDEGSPEPIKGGFVRLNRETGEVQLNRVFPPWEPFSPKMDGRPLLKNCWIDHAQWRGNVLALVVLGPGRDSSLRLFHGPSGVPTRELEPPSKDATSLILSHDGRLYARRIGERQLEVRETSDVGPPLIVTVKGKTHQDAKVTLGRYGLVIHVGKHVSLIRWDGARLTVSTVNEGSTRSEHDVITWPLDRPANRSTPMPKILDYDPHRFVACARSELTAVVDVFGQVALFDAKDQLIAMFVAFRSQVAAWMPDGTRFGPSQGHSPLIDCPATRNAAEIIGRALKAASDHRIAPASSTNLGVGRSNLI